ncbi:MAG: DUF5683 domain-containing protein [Gemmatimonadota bacterium]
MSACPRRWTQVVLLSAGMSLLGAPALQAQDVEAVAPDTARSHDISPRGAFLRSLVVPGWGQAATQAYSRASFYFLVEAVSGLGLYKTLRELEGARERLDFWTTEAERAAVASGLSDPDSILAAVEADPRVEEMRALEEARLSQREDWLAFGLFMLLLGGADAFVSAHLKDFPDPISVSTQPSSAGPPRIEVAVRIPVSAFR